MGICARQYNINIRFEDLLDGRIGAVQSCWEEVYLYVTWAELQNYSMANVLDNRHC